MKNNFPNENPDAQTLLNQVVVEYLRDQKRKRRWRWVTRAVFFLLILLIAYSIFSFRDEQNLSYAKPHVGLIDVRGSIFDSQDASAENFANGLDDAYRNSAMKAVIIRINSPGGSPVQADYMYSAIEYYRKQYPNIKIYAVCADMCASAAYYLAVAADEIYANPASMVGSIGVLYNGFGFVDTMQKLGVSRRLQTAGSNKGFLDPFSPINMKQTKLLQAMLDTVHNRFIERVKEGRGSRLKIDDSTFSGLFWTGQQAIERGLIDGFASSGQVARDIVKVNRVIDYTHKQNVFERVAKSIGTAIMDQLPVSLGLQQGIKA